MQLLPAGPAGHDKARFFEHAQVLHDTEATHLQLGLQLRERAAIAREEQVKQEATARVRERLEHAVVIRHNSRYVT